MNHSVLPLCYVLVFILYQYITSVGLELPLMTMLYCIPLQLPQFPVRAKSTVCKSKAKVDVVSDNCSKTLDYTTDTGDSTEGGTDQSHYWQHDEIAPLERKRKRKLAGPGAR